MPEEEEPTDAPTHTTITGIWVDPMAKYRKRVPKSQPVRVGRVVGTLQHHVTTQVNEMYSFDPPLGTDDMKVERYNRKLYLLYFLFI